MSEIEPYEMLIDTVRGVPPGDGYVMECFLEPRVLFQPDSAKRVDGIDYSAFKVHRAFVGSILQWSGLKNDKEPWPSALIFEKWDAPMSPMQMGLDLTLQFVNTTDKPQRFAMKLVGRLVR